MVRHAIAIVSFLATPAFGVIIDDFSVGPITLAVDGDHPGAREQQTGLDPDSVIGGRRYIGLLSNWWPEGYQTMATVDTAAQTFRLDVDVDMETWGMHWGGGFFDPEFALNADLLSDGADAFRIDVAASIDHAANLVPTTLNLSAGSGANEGLWDADAVGVYFPASDTPYSIRVPFSRFPNVDFYDVDYLAFGGGVGIGTDLTLGAIRTVPEPSTLVTFILGLIGIVCLVAAGCR